MLLQAVFVFGISGLMFWWLPGVYLTIGCLVMSAAVVALMRTLHVEDYENDDDLPRPSIFAVEFVYRILLAAALGAIWPSIPFIFGVRRSSQKAGARPSSTSD